MNRASILLPFIVFCAIVISSHEVMAEGNSDKPEEVSSLEKSVIEKLHLSGYIQGQYQWGEEDASLKVGTANEKDKGSYSRLGLRRGRIKLTYEEKIVTTVIQIDFTEKGIALKDAYFNIEDPWTRCISLQAGIFKRPFGDELAPSSSKRESPERSIIFQTLFPDVRDVGAMITFNAPKSLPLNILRLEAGLFAGNGIKQETDSKRDFMGRLSIGHKWENMTLRGTLSYYNGRVYQGSENIYTMYGNGFELNDNITNKGKYAKREYKGIGILFSAKSRLGITTVGSEYLSGQQPGTAESNKSPNSSSLPSHDTYIRNFRGGYITLVHKIGKSPFSAVAKYDWFDPNIKVAHNGIGENGTGIADIAKSTIGCGMLWDINNAIRLTTYYEFNRNETSTRLPDYSGDIKDDIFTLRLQYTF